MSPLGLVVVVPITRCNCNAISDGRAFRLSPDGVLARNGDPVGVARCEGDWVFRRLRRP